jgi:hypothetical protein
MEFVVLTPLAQDNVTEWARSQYGGASLCPRRYDFQWPRLEEGSIPHIYTRVSLYETRTGVVIRFDQGAL